MAKEQSAITALILSGNSDDISFVFYESDNSHFAIPISVREFDHLTSISVYLRMELEQGYILDRV